MLLGTSLLAKLIIEQAIYERIITHGAYVFHPCPVSTLKTGVHIGIINNPGKLYLNSTAFNAGAISAAR